MNCDDVRELLESYSLGLLDAEQQAAVEAHLDTCPACRELAENYANMIADLPLAINTSTSAHPPDAIKARLLEAISQPSSTVPKVLTPVQRDVRRLLTPRRMLPVAGVLLVLALLIGLGTGLSVALARESALQAQIANLTGQQELVLEVVDSPKMSKVLLRPPSGSTSIAYGKIYTRPDFDDVVVMAARLPMPTAGQAYHVWVTDGTQLRLAGVLTVNAQGFGLLIFKADKPGPIYQSAQLTLQPLGADKPIGSPILLSNPPK